MSLNGISILSTKQAKQLAKLDLAQTKRQGTTQGSALVFSGSAQLDMAAAANTNLGNSTAFTIEVWVYITAYISAANGVIIQQGGQKNVSYATHQLSLANNTIYFNTGTGSGGANTGGKTVSSSTPLPLTTWTHIAVVWDGTNIKLYQGGALVGTTAANPLQMGTNSAAFTIGNISGGGANDYFTGSLSNIRIVKNVAVYTGAFTVPAVPLTSTQTSGTNITAITGTATGLLLNAASSATYLTDSSSYAATVSNSNVTWSASGPSLTSTSANFYRARNTYDITQLPTQYTGNAVTDNANTGGLVVGRPWTSVVNPAPVTQDLILFFDSERTDCYPGTGTTIYNIVDLPTQTPSTLFGDVTFSNGLLRISNTDTPVPTNRISGIQCQTVTGFKTISLWYRQLTDSSGYYSYILDARGGMPGGWIYDTPSNDWFGSDWGAGTMFINGGASQSPTYTQQLNVWRNVTFVTNGTAFTDDIALFSRNNHIEGLDVEFGAVMIYSRTISEAENKQNYDQFKTRYGLS